MIFLATPWSFIGHDIELNLWEKMIHKMIAKETNRQRKLGNHLNLQLPQDSSNSWGWPNERLTNNEMMYKEIFKGNILKIFWHILGSLEVHIHMQGYVHGQEIPEAALMSQQWLTLRHYTSEK